MSAKVVFLNEKSKNENIEDTKQFLVVPMGSVVNRNNLKVVYIVKDERAVEIPVKTGRELGTYIEIISGLSNGEKVIHPVDDKIQDGVKVRTK
jgi:hypothetical protein